MSADISRVGTHSKEPSLLAGEDRQLLVLPDPIAFR